MHHYDRSNELMKEARWINKIINQISNFDD